MKKAQMQMMETFMVLLVFFVLLAMGIFMYFKFSAKGIETAGEEASVMGGTTLLAAVTSMPEIQCSKRGRDESCLDAAKMTIVVEKGTFKGEAYEPLFRKKRVYVNVTYPGLNPYGDSPLWKEECTERADYQTGCGVWVLHDYNFKGRGKKIISTPVSVYYPDKKMHYAGKLLIEL